MLFGFFFSLVFCQGSYSSDFGTEGLISIPNARLFEDGVLRATLSRSKVVDNLNLTYQVLPRLQTTFRYSIFDPREMGGSIDNLMDRSYSLKAKILNEGIFLPQLAVGVRDILGTGAWSS